MNFLHFLIFQIGFGHKHVLNIYNDTIEIRFASTLMLAIHSSRFVGLGNYQFYEVSRLFSLAHSILAEFPPQKKEEIQILTNLLCLVEGKFEHSVFVTAPLVFKQNIKTTTKGKVTEPVYFKKPTIQSNNQGDYNPIALLKLLNYQFNDGMEFTDEDLEKRMHNRFKQPVIFCIKYWRSFNEYMIIASKEIFKICNSAYKDEDHWTSLNRCLHITFGQFDHLSSFGNLMATYFYFGYLRHLLRIACDLDENNEEHHTLYEGVEAKWATFQKSNIPIKTVLRLTKPVKSVWLGTQGFSTKEITENSTRIDKVKIKQIYNYNPKRVGMVSSIISKNNLIINVSIRNSNLKVYEKIMNAILRRLYSKPAAAYTVDTIIHNLL
jgi:hypothetical protein